MLEETPSIVHDVSVAAAVGRSALPRRICTAFTHGTGAQRAALSLLPSLDQWQLLHATDESALVGEAVQFTSADGPSVNAALEMRPVFVSDVQSHRRRTDPDLAKELPDVEQILALPLHACRTPVGVICLYNTQLAQLTARHLDDAQRAADVAVDALLRWRPVHAADTGCERPVWTTDTRAARWRRIHRAVGCVAAREGCCAAEALAWLRAVSAREGLSLLDVADAILQPHDDEDLVLSRRGGRDAEAVRRT